MTELQAWTAWYRQGEANYDVAVDQLLACRGLERRVAVRSVMAARDRWAERLTAYNAFRQARP